MNGKNGWLLKDDSEFYSILRSFSIVIIVIGHAGGFWFYPPWSEFLHVVILILFYISGIVSYYNYTKSESTKKYLVKRISSLTIPYYSLCLVFFLLYISYYHKILSIGCYETLNFLRVLPSEKIEMFPMGHVWFLHTLIIISIFSPLLFLLYHKSINFLILIMCFFVLLSFVQNFYNIGRFFYFFGNNLYKPIVHSVFFVLGFLFHEKVNNLSFVLLLFLSFSFLILSIFLVICFDLNPDYSYHIFYPDFYYLCGGACVLFFLLSIKNLILSAYFSCKLFSSINKFIFKNTFSIYLLHPLVIYISSDFVFKFGIVEKDHKFIFFKLLIVFILTGLLSLPFTFFNKKILSFIDKYK